MLFQRFWLCSIGFVLLTAAPALSLQAPQEIGVRHRSGQTFVTWRELSASDTRYRVYRSPRPILSASDLDGADLLGEVDDRSSRNQGRSLATGIEARWIIAEGEAPLGEDRGLFVHTVGRSSTALSEAHAIGPTGAFYAVTSVRNGVEDTTLQGARNTTAVPLFEAAASPRPVLQAQDSGGELWAHWVGNRDTPFQPALSLLPSHGFNFRFEPGSGPGPRGLLVRLHAAGQTYSQGWPHRFEVREDVDILAPSDLFPFTSWTFWLGAQEDLPGAAGPGTLVRTFTLERVKWTTDWLVERLGAAHDPERVYVIGGSMGAMGSMYLASEDPSRYAAILCRNGNYDLTAPDLGNPTTVERVLGRFALGLLTEDGLPILDRTNAAFMAARDPSLDWPVIRTISGRNDQTVGWSSAVQLFQGLESTFRPAIHYFDVREHTPRGYWADLEAALLFRTLETRRDRPSLRFSDCDLDDDPGNGDPLSGDPIGTINGYLDYDPRTASASVEAVRFDVFLRKSGQLDDAARPSGRARLTPRRTGLFTTLPGEIVRYTLHEEDVLLDEHLLFPDSSGLVHTPLAPLSDRRRVARFEHWTPPARPSLFIGDAPIPGDWLQVVLLGQSGESWTLFVALGNESGPSSIALGTLQLSGTLGATGIRDLWFPLPRFARHWPRLWGRAWIAGRPTDLASVSIQRDESYPRVGVVDAPRPLR